MKRAVRRESLCTVKIGGSCTLYLAEIPSHENTPFHLCNYFCKFGTLLNVVCGYNGDPSAAAVTFEKHESAKAAMKSSNQLLKNRSIKTTLVPSNVGATTSKSKCVLCNKELATKRGLSAHVKRVHSGTTFECEHCKAPFASVNMYKKHLENQHANAIETVVNKKSPDVSDQTKLKEQIKQIASLNAKVESLEKENETSAKKLKLAEKTGKVIENQLKGILALFSNFKSYFD